MTPGTVSLAELFADTPEELRRQALSHSSWVEQRTDSYGRLAFLGDSVLGLAVAALLFDQHPAADIGELTKILNQAVSGRVCAEVAHQLGLPRLLAERAPEEGEGLPVETLLASERTLASVSEAVIGACYLAHGFERTSEAVVETFRAQIEQATRERLDFKSEFQERLARDGETVSYEVVERGRDRRTSGASRSSATVGGERDRQRARAGARRRPSRPLPSARSKSSGASDRRGCVRARREPVSCCNPSHSHVSEGHQPEGLQVLPRPHPADLLAGRQRDRRARTARASRTSPTPCSGRWASRARSRDPRPADARRDLRRRQRPVRRGGSPRSRW